MHIHTINISQLQKNILKFDSDSSHNNDMVDTNFIEKLISKFQKPKFKNIDNLNQLDDQNSNTCQEFNFEFILKKLDIKLEQFKYHESSIKYINYLENLSPSIIYEDFNDIEFYAFFKENSKNAKKLISKVYYTIYYSNIKIKNNRDFDYAFYNDYANIMSIVGLMKFHGIECIYIKEEEL